VIIYKVRSDIMKVCSVAMPSYTYAMKAEKLLSARGFICSIRRRTGKQSATQGCGFSLVISGNCSDALYILDRYSIPYTLDDEGGV